jgi:hypothetical protein
MASAIAAFIAPWRSAQSIGCTRKCAKSHCSSAAGSIPACWPDQLQLIAPALDDLRPGLGADAQPVDPRHRRQRPVALRRDAKAAPVQGRHQRLVQLQHWLAAGNYNQPSVPAFTPQSLDMCGQRIGLGKLAAALAVGADEIGVAEIALRRHPVLLAP